MPSEIRVDTLKNSAGLGTITNANTLCTFSGDVLASGSVSASGKPFFRNSLTISSDYTITTAYNEMSIGPITINSGITVTVNSGATWTVV